MDDASIAVRYVLAFAMLAGAIPSDLRTRRVPNSWWLPFAVMAAVFVVGDLLDTSRTWLGLAVAYGGALVVTGLLYLFWRMRLFGGADAKALMVLAFLCPWPSPEATVAIVPALDALANGSLLVVAIPLVNLGQNLVRGRLVLPAAFLGRPVPIERARAGHVWPMQVAAADGSLSWRYWQKAGLGSLDEEYDALARAGATEVWVTTKIPFLVPLAAGMALAWWPGNLAALLARLVVS